MRDQSELYTLDPGLDEELKSLIVATAKQGDTLGGIVEVRVEGVPFGLGSHTQWNEKLDGRLAQAVMSVQAVKGVEIGMGFEVAKRPGSQVHDPIRYDPSLCDGPSLGFVRPTNNAGGLEAGMTNSQPIIIRAAEKPISTLAQPLESVDLQTKQPDKASYERSDVCAIAAASCVVENVVAFEIARAMVGKFGGGQPDRDAGEMEVVSRFSQSEVGVEVRPRRTRGCVAFGDSLWCVADAPYNLGNKDVPFARRDAAAALHRRIPVAWRGGQPSWSAVGACNVTRQVVSRRKPGGSADRLVCECRLAGLNILVPAQPSLPAIRGEGSRDGSTGLPMPILGSRRKPASRRSGAESADAGLETFAARG